MVLEKIFKILLFIFLIDLSISQIILYNMPSTVLPNYNIFDALATVFGIIQIISVLMLFKFSPKRRLLFVASTFLGIFFTFFGSQFSIPDAKYYDITRYTGGFIDGAIIVMMYLTNLNNRFSK